MSPGDSEPDLAILEIERQNSYVGAESEYLWSASASYLVDQFSGERESHQTGDLSIDRSFHRGSLGLRASSTDRFNQTGQQINLDIAPKLCGIGRRRGSA